MLDWAQAFLAGLKKGLSERKKKGSEENSARFVETIMPSQ